MVEELQRAKADYGLGKALNRLARYAWLVIDDIGSVRKDEAETSVLFELVMHRYERSLPADDQQPAISELGARLLHQRHERGGCGRAGGPQHHGSNK